jgi:hypothetical protein
VIRRWIRSHLSLVATATSASLVVALVATIAVVSGGYPTQRLDLNDASVWVSNGTDQFIGRINTEVLELDSVIPSGGSDIDVVQHGSTVLLFDRGASTVQIVDAATSAVADSIALPPAEPDVMLAGGNVVLYSEGTGEVWITPTAELGDFDAEQRPDLSLGAGSVVSVDPDGLLFAFSPEARKVYSVDAAASATVVSTEDTQLGDGTGEFGVTSVGGRWAVLDVASGRVEVAGHVVDLADALDDTVDGAAGPVLQAPSTAGDAVLVGYSGGLLDVPLVSGEARSLYADASGTPASPAVVDGCAYAAWSGGALWRRCDTAEPAVLALDDVAANARLDFQVNAARVVLNDSRDGASWAVQGGGELVDNWSDLITVDDTTQQVEQNDDSVPPEVERTPLPPVAADDEFGARPGRATSLPVLLNDYDPNADVLVVSSTTDIDPAVGRIDRIGDGQELQLTLEPGAAGSVAFSYTIDDGNGGTATADVSVAIRTDGENSPPEQARATHATVASGGQVTVPVLGDWVDPDGDPFYLQAASVGGGSSVSYTPEGSVILTDGGDGLGETVVTLTASDGSASSTGSLAVTVRAAGDVPIVADPFVVLASAGQQVTVSPLEHVRGGTGAVRLNAVPARDGITIVPSFETGTFLLETDVVGTHYLEYVVTDNEQTVTGLIRLDVAALPDANARPITVPKTVFLPALSSKTIDVAASDIDPAGGVLLVTGVMDVPDDSGVRAEVLEQRSVRVTLTGLLSAPVTFGYRITNGLAESEGSITVIEVADPGRSQPPVARDDTATVRVGDAITIDVLANDEHPDGEAIGLNPVLVKGLEGDSGLLFASGNTLRYLAPDTTGNFTAVYEIVGPLGQTAQAQLTIEVREANTETNNPPVPSTVEARVIAGETVRVEIPLDGIDPDGDSVQLIGQETSPAKGGVTSVGTAWIDYEAGDYSAGTDSFTYTVKDALGARATGTVRIGISPRLDGARNPVAIEDEVTMRPGATVSVRVLANDSDPDGNPLEVVDVQPNDASLTATIDDGTVVTITAPPEPGSYGLVYTIENGVGGSSSNFVTVAVSDDAPLAFPVATDTVLTLSDVLDRDSIDVDVLANVFFADGSARDLDLSIVQGYEGSATVTTSKSIRVRIGDERQIIPFAVAHPDDPSVRSYAFIWVPGYSDALPQLNRDAPAITVTSGEPVTIALADYVLAVDGKQVRLTDSSTVRATHADGSALVVDPQTLRFVSADLYFGPASVSFEVTDGDSAADPGGSKATLVLPITVTPRENQPPVFTGATIDFEPAQEKVIDLTNLTNYPYVDDIGELVYDVQGAAPAGFSYTLAGQQLTVRADESAVTGTSTAITLGVRDALSTGQPGRIQLQVVPSTRPLAVAATDAAVTRRGQTTVIDVLANDEATNPFPGQPLRVVAVRGIDGGSLPAGVSVTASGDNRTLTVAVATSAEPSDSSVQYQLADATGAANRYVWGSVRISVQDVPDAPVAAVRQAAAFTAGQLSLRITAPQQNNSVITNYRVTSSSQGAYTHDCGTTLICALPDLVVGAEYAFQVVATNAVGDSAASPPSEPYTIDYLPAAPRIEVRPSTAAESPSGGSITVTWSPVDDPQPGTAVVGYTVEVEGRAPLQVGRDETSATIGGLAAATTFGVAVYARNGAQVTSAADWQRSAAATVTTVGAPVAPAAAPRSVNQPDGSIEVSWDAFGRNGGSEIEYSVRRVSGAATATDCRAGTIANDVSSPWTDTTPSDGGTYSYIVFASNGLYCTAVAGGVTESIAAPGQGLGTAAVQYSGNGQYDVRVLDDLSVESGRAERYQYRIGDGAWKAVTEGQWLTAAGGDTVYGKSLQVTFRGCREGGDEYCGPASEASVVVPVTVRASVSSCVPDDENPPIIVKPANANMKSVTYALAYKLRDIHGVPEWTGFTYESDEPVPSNAIGVRIRATVVMGSGTYSEPDSGFSQTPCS